MCFPAALSERVAPFGRHAVGFRRARNDRTVAVARGLVCLTCQLFTIGATTSTKRPTATFRKLRMLEIAGGAPKRSNPRGRTSPADTPLSRPHASRYAGDGGAASPYGSSRTTTARQRELEAVSMDYGDDWSRSVRLPRIKLVDNVKR